MKASAVQVVESPRHGTEVQLNHGRRLWIIYRHDGGEIPCFGEQPEGYAVVAHKPLGFDSRTGKPVMWEANKLWVIPTKPNTEQEIRLLVGARYGNRVVDALLTAGVLPLLEPA
jgi:hypothetical protein